MCIIHFVGSDIDLASMCSLGLLVPTSDTLQPAVTLKNGTVQHKACTCIYMCRCSNLEIHIVDDDVGYSIPTKIGYSYMHVAYKTYSQQSNDIWAPLRMIQ